MMERESFGSRFAVIMAMAGSAVGLGNIWRFPYMVGEHGGAAFIIVYMLASFILVLPIFFAETVIGRRSRQGTFGAMEKLAPGTRWKWLGLLTVISPIIILSYYSVVGGWSVEYLFKALAFDFTKAHPETVQGFFPRFISTTWAPILVHTVFMALVAGVVLAGVKKGIEQFTKVTMPVLFVLIVIIAVYSVTLPGAGKGVSYLVKPDFSKIDANAVAAAMGQAFFSLSLGVGTILTYASYMRKDENILASGLGTAVSDLLFAILAGFAGGFCRGHRPGSRSGPCFRNASLHLQQNGRLHPLAQRPDGHPLFPDHFGRRPYIGHFDDGGGRRVPDGGEGDEADGSYPCHHGFCLDGGSPVQHLFWAAFGG